MDNQKEAMLYRKMAGEKLRCDLCARRCVITEGKKGICRVRENREGILYTLVYGRTIAQHADPVEKKPLFHFHPGLRAYSMATAGCNFRCKWCQNWDISQQVSRRHLVMGEQASPRQIVEAAKNAGCRSIAYTYTEPTIFFEYSYDTARLASQEGLKNIYVTNGYMTGEMLELFRPYLDAANVDLKAFREETYREYVGAKLQPVLESMERMKEMDIWLEVTTLIIPGINDSDEELGKAAGFVASRLGVETPWHISRFSPGYQMNDLPPTPCDTLSRAMEIGQKAGLRYIYVGNIPDETGTVCHQCGEMLIRRFGFQVMENRVRPDGSCPRCGAPVDGVEMGGELEG